MSFADFEEYKQLSIGLATSAHMDATGKGPEGRSNSQGIVAAAETSSEIGYL